MIVHGWDCGSHLWSKWFKKCSQYILSSWFLWKSLVFTSVWCQYSQMFACVLILYGVLPWAYFALKPHGPWWVECSGFVFCFWIFRWRLGCFLVTVLTFGVINLLCAVEFSFFSSIPKTCSSVKSIITELLANFWRSITWNYFQLLSELLKIFPQFPNRHLHWLNTWFWPWVFFSLDPLLCRLFIFICFCFSSCNRHHCLKLSLSFSE